MNKNPINKLLTIVDNLLINKLSYNLIVKKDPPDLHRPKKVNRIDRDQNLLT